MSQLNPTIHFICGSTGAGKTTYSSGLGTRLGAAHFSIDDWMVTLFSPDKPHTLNWNWVIERVARCEQQIVSTALQLGRLGIPSILDFGFNNADQRRRVADLVAGRPLQLHYLEVDAGRALAQGQLPERRKRRDFPPCHYSEYVRFHRANLGGAHPAGNVGPERHSRLPLTVRPAHGHGFTAALWQERHRRALAKART